jgi:hypothetical protein
MDKGISDRWFNDNYNKIKKSIAYNKYINQRTYDVCDMVSDVYLYIDENIDKLDDISSLEAMVFNYIKMNNIWNSKITRGYKKNKEYMTTVDNTIQYEDDDISYDLISTIEYTEDDNTYKIMLELGIDYIFKFKDSLDLDEKIFFSRYLEILQKGEKASVRRMMSEFNLKLNQTANLKKSLLNRLSEYLINSGYKHK